MLKRFASALIILVAGASIANAQSAAGTAERVATYNDWSVYVANSANGRVCFAVSQPQNTEPTGVNRGGIYFMLSTWPSRGVHNEASVVIGYPFAEQSTVSVSSTPATPSPSSPSMTVPGSPISTRRTTSSSPCSAAWR